VYLGIFFFTFHHCMFDFIQKYFDIGKLNIKFVG